MKIHAPMVVAVLASCSPAPCVEHDGGGTFCLPDSGVSRAGAPITLEIIGVVCDSTCQVSVDDHTITLSSSGEVCPPGRGPAALIPCAVAATCTVPPLTAGDYTVVSDGVDAGLLHVADAGTNACSLFAN